MTDRVCSICGGRLRGPKRHAYVVGQKLDCGDVARHEGRLPAYLRPRRKERAS